MRGWAIAGGVVGVAALLCAFLSRGCFAIGGEWLAAPLVWAVGALKRLLREVS